MKGQRIRGNGLNRRPRNKQIRKKRVAAMAPARGCGCGKKSVSSMNLYNNPDKQIKIL